MEVRAYYWNSATGRLAWLRPGGSKLSFGNAGDAFNEDLLNWAYPEASITRVADAGQRLLLVGSVVHQVREGDVVNGAGTKRAELPPAPEGAPVWIRGVRGPKTEQALAAAGYDVSAIQFHADPGLLIGRIYPELFAVDAVAGSAIFIPHYRERRKFRKTPDYALVDIDAPPLEIGRQIRRAEMVYSSSLHGVIWAHALGRPAVLVTPLTEEPILKYEDYFESVNTPFRFARSITEALRARPFTLPDGIEGLIDTITLPSAEELSSRGVFR